MNTDILFVHPNASSLIYQDLAKKIPLLNLLFGPECLPIVLGVKEVIQKYLMQKSKDWTFCLVPKNCRVQGSNHLFCSLWAAT